VGGATGGGEPSGRPAFDCHFTARRPSADIAASPRGPIAPVPRSGAARSALANRESEAEERRVRAFGAIDAVRHSPGATAAAPAESTASAIAAFAAGSTPGSRPTPEPARLP
jgi:hypothetical protein